MQAADATGYGPNCKVRKTVLDNFQVHLDNRNCILGSAGRSMSAAKKNRWVAKVKTDSTHPPAGLFTRKAATIARTLASRKVSPKGPSSGMRMLTYFINRAGRGLSAARKAELEKAKASLSKRIERDKKSRQRKAA
jgi:Protein of unknown function (DUF3175)